MPKKKLPATGKTKKEIANELCHYQKIVVGLNFCDNHGHRIIALDEERKQIIEKKLKELGML
jgi:hypothetical protein